MSDFQETTTNWEIIRPFLEGLRPEPRYTVTEWAEKYRYLPSKGAAEPGLYRVSRTPYLKPIMDKLSVGDPCQFIVFMKGAQIGATEIGNNWIGYLIDLVPCPILMVMPTDDTLKRNMSIRIDPMIEGTPRLIEKIGKSRSKDAKNTSKLKSFPGGVLMATGANSAAGLRSIPVRCLMLDEADAYPADLDGEGDPIKLAEKRTATFPRRKIYMPSTPLIKGKSAVESAFEDTDQNYWHVPCPHCGTYQKLVFEQFRWEAGKPETTYYECASCAEPIIEQLHKTDMLEAGHFVADKPENASPRKIGFHVSALYSPLGWYSWEDAVRDWEEAQGKTEKLKSFYNTVLGLTYEEDGDVPEWERIMERALDMPDKQVPRDVVFLSAGVDVQKDRLELEVVGWCRGMRTHSIDYRVILGDTTKQETWNRLSAVVNEQFAREDGAQLPIKITCVDTGYNTHYAYEFCRRFDPSRVIAVKGQESLQIPFTPPSTVDVRMDGRKTGRVRLLNIGIGVFKQRFYGSLKQTVLEDGTYPDGYCWFPKRDSNYFKGLTAERLVAVKDKKRGYTKYVWEKTFERNEPLDCRVYAMAGAAYIGVDRWNEETWEAIEANYSQAKEEPVIERRRSSFWK